MPAWWYQQLAEERQAFELECQDMGTYWTEIAQKLVTVEEVYWESPTDFKVAVMFNGFVSYFHSLSDAEDWLEGWTA
jgi:hypothetical protein